MTRAHVLLRKIQQVGIHVVVTNEVRAADVVTVQMDPLEFSTEYDNICKHV